MAQLTPLMSSRLVGRLDEPTSERIPFLFSPLAAAFVALLTSGDCQ